MLAPALGRADELLIERGRPPLPTGLSPHKLRHTFASTLIACGEDPASVTYQLGHVAPEFTLRVYGHMMRRGPSERARLRAMVNGETPLPDGRLRSRPVETSEEEVVRLVQEHWAWPRR